MKELISCMLVAVTLSGCARDNANKQAAAFEDDWNPEMTAPLGVPRALDSGHNVRVVARGLEPKIQVYSTGQRQWVPSTHEFLIDDTVFFTPVATGWQIVNGKVSVKSSYTVRAPDGSVVREAGTSIKTVNRIEEVDATAGTFAIPLHGLDPSIPYYDVQFSMRDVATGKSMDGIFRIQMKTARTP